MLSRLQSKAAIPVEPEVTGRDLWNCGCVSDDHVGGKGLSYIVELFAFEGVADADTFSPIAYPIPIPAPRAQRTPTTRPMVQGTHLFFSLSLFCSGTGGVGIAAAATGILGC